MAQTGKSHYPKDQDEDCPIKIQNLHSSSAMSENFIEGFKIDMDHISKQLDGFGWYQKCVFCLTCFSSFIAGLMVLSTIYTSQTPEHRCKVRSCDSKNSSYIEDFMNYTTPWDSHHSKWDSCNTYAPVGPSCEPEDFNQTVVPCREYIYNKRVYQKTSVTQFDIVCQKLWLVPFERSSYMAGMAMGALTMGRISDRYGRRFCLFTSVVITAMGAILTVFSPWFEMVVAMRLITGMGGAGCFEASFIIAMEFVGAKKRTSCGILICAPFSLGMIYFILLSYFIRNWKYLMVAASSPCLLICLYFWFLPESVYWLLSKNRNEEAFKIIEKVAKSNNSTVSQTHFQELLKSDQLNKNRCKEKNVSIFVMFKSKAIRKRTLILYYCWSIIQITYYGLVTYKIQVSENVFINEAIKVLVDMPAYFLSVYAIDRLGRKLWHVIIFLLIGLACIAVPILSHANLTHLIGYMGLVGKFGAAAGVASLYLYTGELYPTQFRGTGVGSCSLSSRIGAMFSPFLSNLEIISPILPPSIYGSLSLIAASFICLLPETLGSELPQTLEDCEQIGRTASRTLVRPGQKKRSEDSFI